MDYYIRRALCVAPIYTFSISAAQPRDHLHRAVAPAAPLLATKRTMQLFKRPLSGNPSCVWLLSAAAPCCRLTNSLRSECCPGCYRQMAAMLHIAVSSRQRKRLRSARYALWSHYRLQCSCHKCHADFAVSAGRLTPFQLAALPVSQICARPSQKPQLAPFPLQMVMDVGACVQLGPSAVRCGCCPALCI